MLLLLGSSTLCWHCFKHNYRELLAQRHYASTISKILVEIMPLNISHTENGCYIPLAQVVLAIGALVTVVVAVTVEENQTLSLSLGLAVLYLC